MAERYLALYDLSGIQGFIFRTNRLKEVAGASYLVSRAFFENVPALAGEGPDAWRSRDAGEYENLSSDDARVVYVGGGNALVLFGSKSRAHEFTRELKHRVFAQTGGSLKVCSALVRVGDAARLAEYTNPANPDGLIARLDCSKAKTPQALPARGFSIDRLDNETQEPVVYVPEGTRDGGTTLRCLPRSRWLKLGEYARQHGNVSSKAAHREYGAPLLSLSEHHAFEVNLNRFFGEGREVSPLLGDHGKSWLAVVHIDGNAMGQRIAGYVRQSHERNQGLAEDLADMRSLSSYIGSLYLMALGEMIDDVYGKGDGEGRALPFRPVVADGDDITFVCTSDKAFECVRVFVERLTGAEPPADDSLPSPRDLSVGVGIAIVRNGYPFSSAYEKAEELCKNAKRAALAAYGAEDPTTHARTLTEPVSSVDFQVCGGEQAGDVDDYRRRYLRSHGILGLRPYFAGAAVPEDDERAFETFLRRLGELQAHSAGEGAWVARGKLKGLRDAYGEGPDRAMRCGQNIVARDVSIHAANQGREGTYDEESARRAFVEGFGDPFVEVGGADGLVRFAKYFDALEVLDLCEGVLAGGDGEGA